MLDKSYQGCDSTKGLHHSLGKMPSELETSLKAIQQ